MEKLFRDIPLFVEAAKQKSFTRAADVLDMPLSTVSRRIQHMEKSLGVPLFHRGARNLELTGHGVALYERCRSIVTEAEAAMEDLLQTMHTPRGPVRVAMSGDVYYSFMYGSLSSFMRKWPEIQLEVQFTDRWVDLHSEPFDLDIRAGVFQESSFKVRRLLSMPTALFASPLLLERYSEPKEPADLKRIPCLMFSQHGGSWVMTKGKRKETVHVQPAFLANSAHLLHEIALAGLGVMWLVPSMAHEYVESGEMVPILPGWTIQGVELGIMMPGRQLPQRIRLFVDHIVEYFAASPQFRVMPKDDIPR